VPTRVLHLIDPHPAPGSPRGLFARGAAPDIALIACAHAIAARPQDHHTVAALGPAPPPDLARLLRLAGADDPPIASLPAPLGHAALTWRSLRRAAARLGPFDAVQAWSRRSHLAARMALRHTPALEPPHGACPPFHPAPPADRARIRQALSLDEATPLVALLSDPLHDADTRRFVYLIGILDVAGYDVAGVVDPRAAHLPRARRFHAEAGVGWPMRIATGPLALCLPACDAALVLPPPGRREADHETAALRAWSVARAHALGVSVVGAGAWLPPEACAEDPARVLAPWSNDLRDLIGRLTRLTQDPDLRRAQAEAVQRAAAALNPRGPFAATPDAPTPDAPLSRAGAQTPA
jgi:hypothetical protein